MTSVLGGGAETAATGLGWWHCDSECHPLCPHVLVQLGFALRAHISVWRTMGKALGLGGGGVVHTPQESQSRPLRVREGARRTQ